MVSLNKDRNSVEPLLSGFFLLSHNPPCVIADPHYGNKKQCYKQGVMASIGNDLECDFSKVMDKWAKARSTGNGREHTLPPGKAAEGGWVRDGGKRGLAVRSSRFMDLLGKA